MARIDNAYAYYISTYAQKTVSRYDSHKKSELRKVYNKMVKINKDSPLYKIPNLTDAKKYAIDIKENARSIQNVVASLSDQYGSFEDSFKKRVAMSSDDEKVSVTYIGDGSEESKTNNFDIEVQRLATPQINQGRFLKDNTLSMRPGAYSFDLNTSGGNSRRTQSGCAGQAGQACQLLQSRNYRRNTVRWKRFECAETDFHTDRSGR